MTSFKIVFICALLVLGVAAQGGGGKKKKNAAATAAAAKPAAAAAAAGGKKKTGGATNTRLFGGHNVHRPIHGLGNVGGYQQGFPGAGGVGGLGSLAGIHSSLGGGQYPHGNVGVGGFPGVGVHGVGTPVHPIGNVHGTGIHGTGVPGTGIHGTGIHGTGLHGTGLHGTGLHGTGLHGTGLHGTGIHGTGIHGTGVPGAGGSLTTQQFLGCRYWCKKPDPFNPLKKPQVYCCEGGDEVPQAPITTQIVKPGTCPPVRPLCPPTRNYGPPNTCSNDGKCLGNQKCCFDTCLEEHVCKPPHVPQYGK